MTARHSQLACFFFVASASCATAQSPARKPLEEKRAAAVDAAIMAELQKQGIVGAAVGILQNNEIVYLKAYGFENREKKTPATVQTIFNWASNSKPLAAVAAMQLVEKNQLDLDADVRRYVPEFPAKDHTITTRHLLTHQSGIPHYTNGKVIPTQRNYDHKRPFADPVIALDRFNQSPLLFTPGTKVSYSTYAYILLSAVIQKAGKSPFRTQVEQRIAKPAGMTSLQLDVEYSQQPHWSIGYVKNRQGEVVATRDEANDWKHGGGGFKSNIADFARWAQALNAGKLLSHDMQRETWSVQSLADGTKTSWGLGFTVEDQNGLKVSHNGKQDEVTTRMVLYPQSRHGVVFMCNCGFGEVGAITTAVYKALSSK